MEFLTMKSLRRTTIRPFHVQAIFLSKSIIGTTGSLELGVATYLSLAEAIGLKPDSRVLEISCGTLRVGLHFIGYLEAGHYHCLGRDELFLMASFRYELPSHGFLRKRPLIVRGEDVDFTKFGSENTCDLIDASAVLLQMPDKLVWTGMERLAGKLKYGDGRIFVSHNIKFCSRLGGEETWFEFKRPSKAYPIILLALYGEFEGMP